MDIKTQKDLEKAKVYFQELKLNEAYGILRRYFDRLPFKPEVEHARYIGMFIRTLYELGKKNELNFYLGELEKIYEKNKDSYLGFQLASVYCDVENPRKNLAKQLFDTIIAQNVDEEITLKSKINLMAYIHEPNDDMGACKKILESIDVGKFPLYKNKLDTWKVVIMVKENRLLEAEKALDEFFKTVTQENDWHAFFTAKLWQATVYHELGKKDLAKKVIKEAKYLSEKKPLKEVIRQIQGREDIFAKYTGMGKITFVDEIQSSKVMYENKTTKLKKKSASEKLMRLLIKKKFLDKDLIVKALYDREYTDANDDKLVYYHMHVLRKCLNKIGVPSEAITLDEKGYHLVPEIEKIEGEL